MSKVTPRKERFAELKRLIEMMNAGIVTDEIVRSQLDFTGTFIYQSEVEKFLAAYPFLSKDDFELFAETFNIVKVPTYKTGGSGKGGARLDTEEAAKRLGVAEDKIQDYISKVSLIKETLKEINAMISDDYRVSFAIPKVRKKDSSLEKTSSDEPQPAPAEEAPEEYAVPEGDKDYELTNESL